MIFSRTKSTGPTPEELLARTESTLFGGGPPALGKSNPDFLNLYNTMVATSEALVSRRQGLNAYFITINGFVVTAIGLFLKVGGHERLEGAGIFALSLLGIFLAVAWRNLIISFGQLNTGKFRVIMSMEKYLPASIFAAEWEALDQGRSKEIYRSFTDRERLVPISLAFAYAVTTVLSATIWAGFWHVA